MGRGAPEGVWPPCGHTQTSTWACLLGRWEHGLAKEGGPGTGHLWEDGSSVAGPRLEEGTRGKPGTELGQVLGVGEPSTEGKLKSGCKTGEIAVTG